MFISGIVLIFIDKEANKILSFKLFKMLFSTLIIAVSIYMLWPSETNKPDWQIYSNEKFQTAIENKNKILIDFYADWCIPCKELDALTFSNPKVIEKLKEFKNFKVDMTKTLSQETEDARKKFNIQGMPTLLIFNTKGVEINRLTGFLNADEFLKLIDDVN